METLVTGLEGVARLSEAEAALNTELVSKMRIREVPDWKIEREMRFDEAPYMEDLRENWKTLMFVRRQEIEMRLRWFELLLSHFGRWHVTNREGVIFNDPVTGAAAADLTRKIALVEERQMVLLRKMRFFRQREIAVDL
jgi:hypothetical protein